MIGQIIDGDFEIVKAVGTGSHADVYQAKQLSLGNRTVALKVLSRLYSNLSEADFRKACNALTREGELLGALHAACFCDVYRAGTLADQRPYIALEFAEGRTLAEIAKRGEQMDFIKVVDLLQQWADGLAELHERALVHRDVTPANAVVAESVFGTQRLQIYDFGTVTPINGRADRHRAGFDTERPMGTPAYMSPEQATGGIVDGRADQYALAAIGYELLTTKRPVAVDHKSAANVLDYLRGTGPIPVESFGLLRPDLPPVVERIFHAALDRNPERRFGDIQQFARALQRAAREMAPVAQKSSLISRFFGGGRK